MSTRRQFLTATGAGLLAGLSLSPSATGQAKGPRFRFGLIADPQYADIEPSLPLDRHYRRSLDKLRVCVDDLNGRDLSFVAHLGDAIDRDFTSFDAILPIFAQLRPPVLHVLGNHDYAVDGSHHPRIPERLEMPARYHERRDLAPGWRLLVLDGNAISTFANPPGTPEHSEAQRLIETLQQRGAPQAKPWNGGLGERQRAWLDARLADADAAGKRVLIFCHYPAYPLDPHNLFDDADTLAVVDRHRCVAAWINGHNHAGRYAERSGVHYLTLCGMVETAETTAYAHVDAFDDRLIIHGRDREPSRELILR